MGQVTALVFALVGALAAAAGPHGVWQPQSSDSLAELRGLAVLDGTHAWASGSNATVLRTRDGVSWEKSTVDRGEGLDFRDLEVLSPSAVMLLASGPGEKSQIFRSGNGGSTWTIAHVNPVKDGFYDAIGFWTENDGIVLGDPVGGKFQIRETSDGGRRWYPVKGLEMPDALEGEGAFAASGTCLFVMKGGVDAWFVTGGAKVSRVFHTDTRGQRWTVSEAPIPAGKASAGLFSVVFLDKARGFVSGGDYKEPAFKGLNGARTEDGGATWTPAPISKTGFYSGLSAVPGTESRIVAVGLAGTAATDDAGKTWKTLDATPYNAVAFGAGGAGWAAGPKGTIAKWRPATSSPR